MGSGTVQFSGEDAVPTGSQGVPPSGECVMMGMTHSGKTKLLMAIHRACHLRAEGEPGLDFVPIGSATAGLIRRSVDIMMGNDTDVGTQGNDYFQFQLALRHRGDLNRVRPPRQRANFYVTDPPGEALFPEQPTGAIDRKMGELAAELVQRGKTASSILLCVDMTRDQTPLFRYLPERLGEMATEQVVPYPDSWLDRGRRLFNQPVIPHDDRPALLACDRFLLLLTKADQRADTAYRRMTLQRKYYRPGQSFGPIDLASMMSPVAEARELLGIEVLSSILSYLKPRAQFAVGVSSAGGFDISGLPFLDQRGVPVGDGKPSGPEILRRWVPFGVREAVLFAAFGVYSPTVHRVTAQHLLSDKIRDRPFMPLDEDID